MKAHFYAWFVVLAVGLGLFFLMKNIVPKSVNENKGVSFLEDQVVPNFEFVDLDGRKHTLYEFKGKIVILNFWASWCAPCIQEAPSLVELVNKMGGNVVLIAVSGDNSVEDIRAFVKAFPEMGGDNKYLAWDSGKENINRFGIQKLPETIIIDKNLKFRRKISGETNWAGADSLSFFTKMVNSQ